MESIFNDDIAIIENLFDNKCCSNTTGWKNQVHVEIHPIHRTHISKIVSTITNDYNIGPYARLLLESIPSALLNAKKERSSA